MKIRLCIALLLLPIIITACSTGVTKPKTGSSEKFGDSEPTQTSMTEEENDFVDDSSMEEQAFAWKEEDFFAYNLDGTLYNYPENETLRFSSFYQKDDTAYNYQTSKGIKLGSIAKVALANAYDFDDFEMTVIAKDARKEEFLQKYPKGSEAVLHSNDLNHPDEELHFSITVYLLSDGTLITYNAKDFSLPEIEEGQELEKCYDLYFCIVKDTVAVWEVGEHDCHMSKEEVDEYNAATKKDDKEESNEESNKTETQNSESTKEIIEVDEYSQGKKNAIYYELNYEVPSSWKYKESDGSVYYYPQNDNGLVMFMVYEVENPSSDTDLLSASSEIVSGFAGGVDTFSQTSSISKETNLYGTEFYKCTAEMTLSGKRLNSSFYILYREKMVYCIVCADYADAQYTSVKDFEKLSLTLYFEENLYDKSYDSETMSKVIGAGQSIAYNVPNNWEVTEYEEGALTKSIYVSPDTEAVLVVEYWKGLNEAEFISNSSDPARGMFLEALFKTLQESYPSCEVNPGYTTYTNALNVPFDKLSGITQLTEDDIEPFDTEAYILYIKENIYIFYIYTKPNVSLSTVELLSSVIDSIHLIN
ncbi:MAG: hypothetical protein J5589_12340 [Firmicutes bacterium]|nr:hypothetical protein [Bacillota bacterium]